ncbi:MAG: LCP family protein [Agrococcus casei]|uniref:LCP family protein n=1 Tax=Agrococcus casei TaxID=343512 RepID=UPI003F9B2EB9
MTATETVDKPRKKRRVRKVLWILLGVVVVLAIAIAALLLRLNSAFDGVSTVESAFPDDSDRPKVVETESGSPINVLLLGTDSREEGQDLMDNLGDRADAILVAHIPPDRKSIQIMSVMRDSWVEIPGHGENKINAALSLGGISLMVQTVETVIDQRIDHVAVIDFEGFKGLTEELGGVTLNNDRAFSTKNYDFEAGNITISEGEAALEFVRERYAFEDGDYQRVHNQQAFMRGALNGILAPEVLANPLKLADIIESLSPHMATTDTMSTTQMVSLGASLVSANGGKPPLQTFTMPTTGTGMIGDQSVVHVDWDGVELIREAFAEDSMTSFTPPPPR